LLLFHSACRQYYTARSRCAADGSRPRERARSFRGENSSGCDVVPQSLCMYWVTNLKSLEDPQWAKKHMVHGPSSLDAAAVAFEREQHITYKVISTQLYSNLINRQLRLVHHGNSGAMRAWAAQHSLLQRRRCPDERCTGMSFARTARPIELQHTALADENRYWPRTGPHRCIFAGEEVVLI
jgi:hypothetical protein